MKSERINFYKYFPVSEADTKWGIFIENVGMSQLVMATCWKAIADKQLKCYIRT